MNVGWLIDADIFEGYRDALVASIDAQGDQARLVHAPSPPYRWDDIGCSYNDAFPADACVIAHGDIEFVTRIQREQRWRPGAFCTVENFACSNYACWYGEHLLNRDYIMLPFAELTRCQDFLFDAVGRDGRIFVRPDSPLKLFTGQVATRDTLAADIEFMGFYEFPGNSLVVVSSPKTILHEWRFVVANGQVVAGCHYKQGDEFDARPDYDRQAFELAKQIASIDYQPDPVWVMDICQTADRAFHLLEIGGFSFSNLYACHMPDVVAAVSAAARAEWKKSLATG